MPIAFTDVHRAVLTAFAEHVIPRIDVADDPHRFWATSGTDVSAHLWAEGILADQVPDADAPALTQLLDGMAGLGFAHQDSEVREVILRVMAGISPEAAAAIRQLRQLLLLVGYAMPDASGRNPLWAGVGYPGPVRPTADEPRTITPYVPSDGEVLTADIVIVGSGAGGGVIAGELAAAGRSVVVLEAGGNFDTADFNQLELWASPNLYYRAGLAATADGNVGLLAGATLGGGTTVNWSNTVPTHPFVRAQWAAEHGLTDIDTPSYDEDLRAVMSRIKASDVTADLNGPHQRLTEAADALGWSWHKALLNIDPERYDYAASAYTGYGDVTGAKQGTLRTYLADAQAAGARILVRTMVEQVCVEGGRASGVVATFADPATGATARVTVRAPHVVVAAGALETPAILLRSGIGGPAAGRHLRLHPVAPLSAVYPEPQDWWVGPVHAAIVDEFRDLDDGYGFLLEGLHFNIGQGAALTTARTPREHKELMSRMRHVVSLIALVRDHGGGSVTLGPDGAAQHWYDVSADVVDDAHWRRGLVAVAQVHETAGAEAIYPLMPGLAPWRRGEDFDAYCRTLSQVPIGAAGYYVGSAHQMGSARMGLDPATSVASPTGELHDTRGVWIGDTSAFPTASGTNPMLTCMALARRTARHINDAFAAAPTVAPPMGAVRA